MSKSRVDAAPSVIGRLQVAGHDRGNHGATAASLRPSAVPTLRRAITSRETLGIGFITRTERRQPPRRERAEHIVFAQRQRPGAFSARGTRDQQIG